MKHSVKIIKKIDAKMQKFEKKRDWNSHSEILYSYLYTPT